MAEKDSKDNRKSEKTRSFSILEKCDILDEFDKGVKVRIICDKYGIPRRTFRNWIDRKNKLRVVKASYQLTSKNKRIKKSAFDDLEEAVYLWFDCTVKSGFSVTGPLIRAKALELYSEMKINKEFLASDGWLTNWKKKFDICQYTRCEEELSADDAAAASFKSTFEKIMEEEQLHPCQIFNADETGLNFKEMPKKTVSETSQSAPSGFVVNKDRVIVMLCSNADGSMRLPPVVIGQSVKPRAIKNMSSLPVYYKSQKSVWMSAETFEKWYQEEFVPKVTKFLKSKGLPLKAKLLLDNAPCHPPFERLSVGEIGVLYFPPNTTAIMQPMNQGIIETVKMVYKSLFLFGILYAQKNGDDISKYLKSIDIKKVIEWLTQAWGNVKDKTIFECWRKVLPARYFSTNDDSSNESLGIEEITNNIQRINEYENINERTVREWITTDLEYDGVPTNAELLNIVTSEKNIPDSEDNSTESMNPKQAVEAAETLLSFFEKNPVVPQAVIQNIKEAKVAAMKIAIAE